MNENLHDFPLELGEDLAPLEGEEALDQNLPLFFLNDDQDDFGVLNIPGLASFPSRHNLLAEDFQFEFTPPSSPRPPSTSLLASIFLSSASPSASPIFLSPNIVNITQEPTTTASNLERVPPKTTQAVEKSLPTKLLSSSTPSNSTPSLPSHTAPKPQSSIPKPASASSKPSSVSLTSSLPLSPMPKQASLTASLPLLTSSTPSSAPSHTSKPPSSTPKPIAAPPIHKTRKDLMIVRSHSVEMPRMPRKEAKKELMETEFDMEDNEDKSEKGGTFRPSFENIRPQEWEHGPSSSARLQSTSAKVNKTTRLSLQAHHKTPSAPTSSRKSATKDKEKDRVEKLTHQKKVLQDKLHEMEKKTQDRTKNSPGLKKNTNNPNTSSVILPQSL